MFGHAFWGRVRQDAETGCWVWAGPQNGLGYGRFNEPTTRRQLRAHRVAYEQLVGEIPVGLVLDHLCRNTLCVNPWHLDPVPNGVNVRRGQSPSSVNRQKSACVKGHEFTDENTYRTKDGSRFCRACHRDHERVRRARRVATRGV